MNKARFHITHTHTNRDKREKEGERGGGWVDLSAKTNLPCPLGWSDKAFFSIFKNLYNFKFNSKKSVLEVNIFLEFAETFLLHQRTIAKKSKRKCVYCISYIFLRF